jgi:hypothetical protein
MLHTFVALSLLSELGEVNRVFAGFRHLADETKTSIHGGA